MNDWSLCSMEELDLDEDAVCLFQDDDYKVYFNKFSGQYRIFHKNVIELKNAGIKDVQIFFRQKAKDLKLNRRRSCGYCRERLLGCDED